VTHVLIQQDQLALCLMQDRLEDYTLMARWLTDPAVLAYYEGRDNPFPLERVQRKYTPRVHGQHPTMPCFMLDATTPVGYLQYYPLAADQRLAFDIPDGARSFGMDLFIGETNRWSRGLGTSFVCLATRYLVGTCAATHITLDPRADNLRAMKCYQKCGFHLWKRLPQHEYFEGAYRDCWLMVYTRLAASQETTSGANR
jgi:aminoglycoside 6'-N-acetyltransferase